MKKIFYTLMAIVISAFSLQSCEDVPFPYDIPNASGGVGSDTPAAELLGSGTVDDPYNVAAVLAYIKTLDADVESEKEVYVKGKVKIISTTEETIKQYGNHTFTMVDEGSDIVFTAFQVYGPGKKKFTSMDQLKEGDEVVVCGKVVNYKGNTPETVGKGASYVYSINGKSEPTPSTPTDGTLTVAQALDAQGSTATVKGYIVGALKYGVSSSSGDIADIELSAPFTGYNALFIADSPTETNPAKMLCAKLNDSESPADLKSKVNLKDNPGNLGKQLTLTGNLKSCYTGLKGIRGITSYTLDGSGSTEQPSTAEPVKITIADFNAAAESTSVWYELTGTISNLKDGDQYGNFDLTDATGSVYVYGVLSTKGGAKKLFQELVSQYGVANGKTITIIGNRGSYNGKIEVTNAYFVKVE